MLPNGIFVHMGSKSKELGVRHTNRERPLVGTYAVRTFALLSVVSGVRSSQFGVRIWRLAVGRASPVAYWSSVRRKHFAAALSCQPINSHICVELQYYSLRVSVCMHTNKQLTPTAISFLVTSKLQVEVRNVAAVAVCYCCYWCFCCCRLQLFKQRLQCAVNR